MPAARAALRLRRVRQRFGINAPQLAVRAQLAWHWRLLALAAALAFTLAVALAAYEFGRRGAGNFRLSVASEVAELERRVAVLDEEIVRLRALSAASESSLQIERVAQQQLAGQVRALEAENDGLRDDLAFFEGLIPASEAAPDTGPRIHRLRVVRDGTSDRYHYRMLLVNDQRKADKEFRGSLQFRVAVRRADGDAMILLPADGAQPDDRFRVVFRRFQRLEGEFAMPAGTAVTAVEARLVEGGEVRARQSAKL